LEQITTFGASGYSTGHLHLFREVDDVADLLADCPVMRAASGQAVAEISGRGGCLYIVLRGALNVQPMVTQGGIADGTVTRVLPGECVGELSVLDEEINTASITAVQETDLLVIEADRLWQLIDESNGIARNLLRLMSFRLRAANAQLRKRQKVGEFYRQLSMRDGLTGLHNRAWLDDHLPQLIDDAHATAVPLSIVMIDLDYFKKFNDTHGHLGGDEALKAASRVLENTIRPTDFAVRYGGEEMMVVLPSSSQADAAMVAQRLCERMRQTVVFADMRQPLPHLTASFGVAGLLPEQIAVELIAAADAALYRAKETGRDRVVEAH
jgi:diguanylate cyclase (GGDEF)-like protein